MRRTLLLVLPLMALTVGCSRHAPVSPTAIPVGSVQDVKGEKPVNVNGVISVFSGDATAFQFLIDGTLVKGDIATEFFGDSAFHHLADGVRVEVKGRQRSGFVYAARLHVNGPRHDEPPGGGTPPCTWTQGEGPGDGPGGEPDTVLQGFIFSLDGVAPDLTLNASGRVVHTSADTRLSRLGAVLPLDILRTGLIIEIAGNQRPDISIDASTISILSDTLDANAEGLVAGLTGAFPNMQFAIDTTTVITHEFTLFVPGPCEALADGAAARVRGVLMPDDATVLATHVELITN